MITVVGNYINCAKIGAISITRSDKFRLSTFDSRYEFRFSINDFRNICQKII